MFKPGGVFFFQAPDDVERGRRTRGFGRIARGLSSAKVVFFQPPESLERGKPKGFEEWFKVFSRSSMGP